MAGFGVQGQDISGFRFCNGVAVFVVGDEHTINRVRAASIQEGSPRRERCARLFSEQVGAVGVLGGFVPTGSYREKEKGGRVFPSQSWLR